MRNLPEGFTRSLLHCLMCLFEYPDRQATISSFSFLSLSTITLQLHKTEGYITEYDMDSNALKQLLLLQFRPRAGGNTSYSGSRRATFFAKKDTQGMDIAAF